MWCVCRLKASETGDYSFCFDNSFSQFSTKVVFFELFIGSDDDDDEDDDEAQFANLPDNTDYDVKLDDFKVTELLFLYGQKNDDNFVRNTGSNNSNIMLVTVLRPNSI